MFLGVLNLNGWFLVVQRAIGARESGAGDRTEPSLILTIKPDELLSLQAGINAPQTPLEEKLSFPRRRESKAYRRGTKSAINYVHLLM